jgi:hypothetical protein
LLIISSYNKNKTGLCIGVERKISRGSFVRRQAPDLDYNKRHCFLENPMSEPHDTQVTDPVEAIVKHVPVVIPLVGALLMLLMAFIAVFMT